MNQKGIFAGLMLVLLGMLCGCVTKTEEGEKLNTLEFTVVKEEDIPEELADKIEKHRREAFQGTYEDKGYLYIIKCYGEQETTGYSIEVNEVYETEDAVVMDTTLLGPPRGEEIFEKKTCPYVVIKLEATKKEVQWR